ncbi:uncharacterized protein HKW66_Vig0127820 [Vigna angularis]|uniref:Uncharacterized protein n=1 Tax=Phaseolus angularis TaxID=3914 RepID=A0A8T0K2V4_PHAAN|nr:uncharacterized protein HKW66_Vig0127820 [Vigna angularis]
MIMASWNKNIEKQIVYNFIVEDGHDERTKNKVKEGEESEDVHAEEDGHDERTKNEVNEGEESEEVHDVGVREEVDFLRF